MTTDESPYTEAMALLDLHPGTGATTSLAKLLLCLWSPECSFPLRDCLHPSTAALSLRLLAYYVNRGETAELVAAGSQVCRDYPELWAVGHTARQVEGEWYV